jgi:hypothetical protein
MRERPIGVAALTLASVVVGIFSLVIAIALLLGVSIGAVWSGDGGTGAFLIGLIAFGLAPAAFFVGGGLWLQKHWAWAGAIVMFGAVIVVSLALVVIGSSLVAAIVPVAAAALAIAFLMRPSTKADLQAPGTTEATASVA